jgi:hypothetical protein
MDHLLSSSLHGRIQIGYFNRNYKLQEICQSTYQGKGAFRLTPKPDIQSCYCLSSESNMKVSPSPLLGYGPNPPQTMDLGLLVELTIQGHSGKSLCIILRQQEVHPGANESHFSYQGRLSP